MTSLSDLMYPPLRRLAAEQGYPVEWGPEAFTPDELKWAFQHDEFKWLKEEAVRRVRARDYWWPWSEER